MGPLEHALSPHSELLEAELRSAPFFQLETVARFAKEVVAPKVAEVCFNWKVGLKEAGSSRWTNMIL